MYRALCRLNMLCHCCYVLCYPLCFSGLSSHYSYIFHFVLSGVLFSFCLLLSFQLSFLRFVTDPNSRSSTTTRISVEIFPEVSSAALSSECAARGSRPQGSVSGGPPHLHKNWVCRAVLHVGSSSTPQPSEDIYDPFELQQYAGLWPLSSRRSTRRPGATTVGSICSERTAGRVLHRTSVFLSAPTRASSCVQSRPGRRRRYRTGPRNTEGAMLCSSRLPTESILGQFEP